MVIYLRHLRKPVMAVVIFVLLAAGALSLWGKAWRNGSTGTAIGEERAVEAFLAAVSCFGRVEEQMEIFNIEKGEVVRKVEMTDADRTGMKAVLENVTGMVVKVKAFPEKGHIARIPLKPALDIQNKWLTDNGLTSVSEAFLIFPEGKNPYLLLLDSAYRPLFFEFRLTEDGRKLVDNLNKSFPVSQNSD